MYLVQGIGGETSIYLGGPPPNLVCTIHTYIHTWQQFDWIKNNSKSNLTWLASSSNNIIEYSCSLYAMLNLNPVSYVNRSMLEYTMTSWIKYGGGTWPPSATYGTGVCSVLARPQLVSSPDHTFFIVTWGNEKLSRDYCWLGGLGTRLVCVCHVCVCACVCSVCMSFVCVCVCVCVILRDTCGCSYFSPRSQGLKCAMQA